jgi:hypothetical protein
MCARNEGSDCPICQGVELPEDLVSLIGQAGAAAPSEPMTADQFIAWLRDI